MASTLSRRAVRRLAERHDLAVLDADVAAAARGAGAIDDFAAHDLQVIRHVATPL
jgi:hypothetical protein